MRLSCGTHVSQDTLKIGKWVLLRSFLEIEKDGWLGGPTEVVVFSFYGAVSPHWKLNVEPPIYLFISLPLELVLKISVVIPVIDSMGLLKLLPNHLFIFLVDWIMILAMES